MACYVYFLIPRSNEKKEQEPFQKLSSIFIRGNALGQLLSVRSEAVLNQWKSYIKHPESNIFETSNLQQLQVLQVPVQVHR